MHQFKRNNHYVPELYLKNWSRDGNTIYSYRLLVSTNKVKKWNLKSIKETAFFTDLYTRYCTDGETDEIENWLNDEFEMPAKESIVKAISGDPLKPNDWRNLIRFIAAQYVRTPARLQKTFTRWKLNMPATVETALKNATDELENNKNDNNINPSPALDSTLSILNSKVTINSLGDGTSRILLETGVNRSMWLWSVKHALTEIIDVLHDHKWQIIRSDPNIDWITSDDPVICLNFYDKDNYNFEGGWGQKGTEIICPISPKLMLYTQVGDKKRKDPILSKELSASFQKLFGEHAFRFIFADHPIESIGSIRKRHISIESFNAEQKEWIEWNDKQKASESSFIKR